MKAKQRKISTSGKKKQWVVIASQAETKIFEKIKGARPNLKELIKFESPEARSFNRDIMRHQIGSGISGGNQKGVGYRGAGSRRYGLSSSKSPREGAAERFAKKIVRYLISQHAVGNFQELFFAAEPHFIGKVRGSLLSSIPTAKFVKKDFCKTPHGDLEKIFSTIK